MLPRQIPRLRLRWLVLFVVLIRLAYLALVLTFLKSDPAEEIYDELARNLLAGHGYVIHPGGPPSLYRPPLYPLLLTGMCRIFGASYYPVWGVQFLFDVLTGVLVYFMARHIFGRATAGLALILYALYPFFSCYTPRLLTESVFTLLLTFGVLAFCRGLQSSALKHAVAAGFAFGLGTLCRFSMFYGIPALAALTLLLRPKSRATWLTVLVMGATALVTLAPWTVRNYVVTGRFLLLGTGSGYNLWLGNHVPTDGRDNDELRERDLVVLQADIAAVVGPQGDKLSLENDRRFSMAALQEFKADPWSGVVLAAKKALRFWFDVFQPSHRKVMIVLVPIQMTLLILAGVGSFWALRARAAAWPLVAIIAYFNVLHAVTVATFRYCIPVMPLVLILTASAIVKWRKELLRHPPFNAGFAEI